MSRVRRGSKKNQRRKKILKAAKGYYGMKSRVSKHALETVEKGLQYAYRDRRNRKREFRSLWIVRINAAARQHGLSYSRLMCGLKKAQVGLDRKSLAGLAYQDPEGFARVAEVAREALA
jgi:large subunit ribosomal protein L20